MLSSILASQETIFYVILLKISLGYLLPSQKVLLLVYVFSLIRYCVFWHANVTLEILQQTTKHMLQLYVPSRVLFYICKNSIYVIDITLQKNSDHCDEQGMNEYQNLLHQYRFRFAVCSSF